jgi:hypothetical protein
MSDAALRPVTSRQRLLRLNVQHENRSRTTPSSPNRWSQAAYQLRAAANCFCHGASDAQEGPQAHRHLRTAAHWPEDKRRRNIGQARGKPDIRKRHVMHDVEGILGVKFARDPC